MNSFDTMPRSNKSWWTRNFNGEGAVFASLFFVLVFGVGTLCLYHGFKEEVRGEYYLDGVNGVFSICQEVQHAENPCTNVNNIHLEDVVNEIVKLNEARKGINGN